MSKLLTLTILVIGATAAIAGPPIDQPTAQVSDEATPTPLSAKQVWIRDAIDDLLTGSPDQPAVRPGAPRR